MASTVRMLMVGLSLAANTVALMVCALGGGAALTAVELWYDSFEYTTTPVIDPGQISWIFPLFYITLICLEGALIWAAWVTIFSRKVYYPEQGW